MSEFSDLLSLFIKTRDINVSALTSYCDLDRSTMYKLINGKRTPSSKELVQNLAAFMNLNPVETQELINAYHLTKVGWDTYYRRRNVLEFILDFTIPGSHGESVFPFTSSPDFWEYQLPNQDSAKDSFALSGQLQLSAAIHSILYEAASKKKGTICIFAQPEHLESLNIAASLPHCPSDIKVQHILCINNNKSFIKSQQNYNIQCLKKIIPFFGTRYDYQPYYYYDNVNSHFNNLNFMPCMFLTQKAAILCSGDLKEGILLKSRDVLTLFQKRFREILKKTSPLTLGFASSMNFHLKNMISIFAEVQTVYGLSAEPCLMPCFTPEILDKYLISQVPNRKQLLEELQQYIKSFTNSSLHLHFTRDGVMNFLMSGRLHEIPSNLYRPIDYEDRIKLLKKLCDQIENGHDVRLLKSSLEKFPLNLHLFIASNYGYLMFSGQNKNLTYILLNEQNILTSFFDFASSLEENKMLESKEETLAFLRSFIKSNAKIGNLQAEPPVGYIQK